MWKTLPSTPQPAGALYVCLVDDIGGLWVQVSELYQALDIKPTPEGSCGSFGRIGFESWLEFVDGKIMLHHLTHLVICSQSSRRLMVVGSLQLVERRCKNSWVPDLHSWGRPVGKADSSPRRRALLAQEASLRKIISTKWKKSIQLEAALPLLGMQAPEHKGIGGAWYKASGIAFPHLLVRVRWKILCFNTEPVHTICPSISI